MGMPASCARFSASSKMLPPAKVMMMPSGFWAMAASRLLSCSWKLPSFCKKTIWQSAFIWAQASSMPRLTACQKTLVGAEWRM